MYKKLTKVLAAFLIILNIICLSSYTIADNNKHNNKHKVVIISIDQISIKDLQNIELKNVYRLIENGSLGIMNTNTAGPKESQNNFATIAAGSKALGGDSVQDIFNSNEIIAGQNIKKIYKFNVGHSSNNYQVVFPYLWNIQNLNSNNQNNAIPFLLGETIHKSGLKTAVVGNADLGIDSTYLNSKNRYFNPNRSFAQLLLDAKGRIDYGDVSTDILKKDAEYPYGVKTDNAKVFRKFIQYYKKADVIQVALGDIDRLENMKQNLSKFRYELYKKNILKYNDQLIGKILNSIDTNTEVIMMTPTPSSDSLKTNQQLTPVIFHSTELNRGLITSGTTHRQGIIVNTDIAVSILDYLKIIDFSKKNYINFSGQVVKVFPNYSGAQTSYGKLKFMNDLNDRIVFNTMQRVYTLATYVYYVVICVLFALIYLWYRRKKSAENGIISRIIEKLLISIIFIPVSMLLLPLFKPTNLFFSYFYIVLLTIIFTIVIQKILKDTLKCFIVGSILAAVLLIIDVFTGSYLLQNCPLGYDPQIGARYFGLGNEVMGVLLGATILATTLIMDRIKSNKNISIAKAVSVAVYLFIIFVLTYPGLGTKAGGAITAVAGFGVVMFKLYGKKVTWKQVTAIVVGIVALLLAMIVIDISHKGGAQSHIGRAAELIRSGGAIQAWYIIERKLATNLKLINHSRWTYILILSLVTLIVMLKSFKDIFKKHAYAYTGFIGIIVTALVGLVFNDSGVIACATSIVYAITLLVCLEMRYWTSLRIERNMH